jgi:spore germination cell wall hydrolase CwlJ-like protein
MALGVQIAAKTKGGRNRGLPLWAPLVLLIPAASCVPATLASPPDVTLSRAEIAAFTAPSPLDAGTSSAPGFSFLIGDQAFVANAAIPVVAGPNPAANSYVFNGRTPLDQMRSVDCLAQAVYYEARSESENGQRAVAQVVLNRVLHPSWPNSVCGVVYQGPMRAGGGCQFTFTCDGSLGTRPYGPNWTEAQRIAMEALGGRTYAPVGLSTHYHTNAVFPSWAPRLTKTAVIGAHIFYRLPGLAGAQGAFGDAYAGSEPLARPAMTMAFRQAAVSAGPEALVRLDPGSGVRIHAAAPAPSDIPQEARWTAGNLPQSNVREEHQQSGQWREDAPAAVTGR